MATGKAVALGHQSHDSQEHEHVHADGTRYRHAHAAPGHRHDHPHGHSATIEVEARILAKNDALAARNRAWLADRGVAALNLMGAPGAGKTALLERTIRDLGGELSLSVIEGDQATANDGQRIRAAGAAAVQVNTGTGCHLEAGMVASALAELGPAAGSIVVIENVGNLVCPALFDLGEQRKIVILSVTEGDDKPLKYPHMFGAADLMLISKIDLAPHVEFDLSRAIDNALQINPAIAVHSLSARSGEGLEAWYAWLRRQSTTQRDARSLPYGG